MSEQSLGAQQRRTLDLVLALAVGLAFTGYIVGIRSAPRSARALTAPAPQPIAAGEAEAAGVSEAVPYMQMGEQRRGPNAGFASALGGVAGDGKRAPLEKAPTDDEVKAALAQRAERRAFDGAPPVVPHPVPQRGALACLACHEKGMKVGDRAAPAMSHKHLTSCTQCHVEQVSRRWGETPWPAGRVSSFVGVESPLHGGRAFEGAPPTMPHSSWMRERCDSCHGPSAPKGLWTSHYDRQNCTQCHAPTAAFEMRKHPLHGPTLPPGPGLK